MTGSDLIPSRPALARNNPTEQHPSKLSSTERTKEVLDKITRITPARGQLRDCLDGEYRTDPMGHRHARLLGR